MWSEVDPEAMLEFNSLKLLVKSQSEPDLVHLLNEPCENVEKVEKRPHPSSRPLMRPLSPVKRQKSWQEKPNQSIKRSNEVKSRSSSPTSPNCTPPEAELTSFV